jgi:tetratricopeptide (TPR) repeat protein
MSVEARHLDHVIALRDGGQLDAALLEANALIAASPEEPRLWAVLGTVLAELGRREDAIVAYSEAIARVPGLPEEHPLSGWGFGILWYNRAGEHARLGHHAEALADVKEAVARSPALADALASDDSFRDFVSHQEFQQLIERGRLSEQRNESLRRESTLRGLREEALEILDGSKRFTSLEVVECGRRIVLGAMDAITAQSSDDEVTRLLESAFASLVEIFSKSAPRSPEAVLCQRMAQRLIRVAILFHLSYIVEQQDAGPWYDW